jgi:PleD family two-component response regulator
MAMILPHTDLDASHPIADADAALYAAERAGKNRAIAAPARTANVFPGK